MSVISDFFQAVLEGLGNLIRVIPDAFAAVLENAENTDLHRIRAMGVYFPCPFCIIEVDPFAAE